MPVYSVNRRRAIILLVLSSVLLLTLDLRGNALINRSRSLFALALQPFHTAGDVITTPIRNMWHGATDYEEQQRRIEELEDLLAAQKGADLANRASYYDYQELLTLNGLTASYKSVTARVIGGDPGNFRQTIEIDRGENDGIDVGMAVVNAAGLVGKITNIYPDSSVVLLLTDSEYTIECKVSGASSQPAGSDGASTTTVNSTPSGVDIGDLTSTTTTLAPTTTSSSIAGEATADGIPGQAIPGGASTDTGGTETGTTSATIDPAGTTTTLNAPPVTVLEERETGGCEGRGADKLPAMRFVTENPVFGAIEVGNVITTTGGSKSLAPPDLIIGEVINKVERAGSAGPLLEIKVSADLDHLNLVQVVLYAPPSEVPG